MVDRSEFPKPAPGKAFRPVGATGPSRSINPTDIFKPTAAIHLAVGPNGIPAQLPFNSKYLAIQSATFPNDIDVSFDGHTFQNWPAGFVFTEIPGVDFIWIRNQNSSANVVVVAVGNCKLQDNRLVVPPATIITVARSPATAASGPTAFSSTVSATLLAANTSRKGFTIMNPAGNPTLYFNLGASAAVVGLTGVTLLAGQYYECPFSYTGIVKGIMASAGSVYVQELT